MVDMESCAVRNDKCDRSTKLRAEVDAELIPICMRCRNHRVTLGLGSAGTARVTLGLEPAGTADSPVESMTATKALLPLSVTQRIRHPRHDRPAG